MLLRLALLALIAAPLAAQTPDPAPPPSAPPPATVKVRIVTSEGPIVLALEKDRAPVTTANFLKYVDQKRFDGTSFYRATNIAPGFGLIQGGVRNDPKRVLPPIAHESTLKTGLTHAAGTISMARGKPGSATGDFFITVGGLNSLDADLSKPGDNLGFAAFGNVVEGDDVVLKILAAPTSPTEGAGVMKGQMIAKPVTIVTVRRVTP